MFCETHNQSLTHAAAGGEPPLALRDHLDACEACRTAFAEEQSLYASIDTALRAAANPGMPSTLLPRVRVALNNEQLPQFNYQRWMLAGAVFASALVVAVILEFRHHETSTPAQVTVVSSPASRGNELHLPAAAAAPLVQRQSKKSETGQTSSANTPAGFNAEVLVPNEERVAFEKFLAREKVPSANSSAAVLLVPEAPKELVPLPAVEIASLKVLPLNGEDGSQGEF